MKWTYIPMIIGGIFIGSVAYPSIQQVSLEEAQKVALNTIGSNTNTRLLKAGADKIKSVNQLTDSGHSLMYE